MSKTLVVRHKNKRKRVDENISSSNSRLSFTFLKTNKSQSNQEIEKPRYNTTIRRSLTTLRDFLTLKSNKKVTENGIFSSWKKGLNFKSNKVFGVRIEELMKRQMNKGNKLHVPWIFCLFLQHVFNKGLKSTGIFRLSASKIITEQLITKLNNGQEINLEEHDANVSGDLFKTWIRQLPTPLFPSSSWNYISTMKEEQEGKLVEHFRIWNKIKNEMDTNHLYIIHLIIAVLKEVSKHKDKNLMDSSNLAKVFAPNTIKAPKDTDLLEELNIIPIINEFFTFLIDQDEEIIFPRFVLTKNTILLSEIKSKSCSFFLKSKLTPLPKNTLKLQNTNSRKRKIVSSPRRNCPSSLNDEHTSPNKKLRISLTQHEDKSTRKALTPISQSELNSPSLETLRKRSNQRKSLQNKVLKKKNIVKQIKRRKRKLKRRAIYLPTSPINLNDPTFYI